MSEEPCRSLRPLAAPRLLARAPRLRRLLLYTLTLEPGITPHGELRPAAAGSWEDAADAAPRCLEELAICVSDRGDLGAPPPGGVFGMSPGGLGGGSGSGAAALRRAAFPSLHTLHAAARSPAAFSGVELPRALPALRRAVFGDACSDAPAGLPPLAALGALPQLESLTLAAGEWGADAEGGIDFRQLRGCTSLTELELFDLRRTPGAARRRAAAAAAVGYGGAGDDYDGTGFSDDGSDGDFEADEVMDAPDALDLDDLICAARSPPRLSSLTLAAPRDALPALPRALRGAAAGVMRAAAGEGLDVAICDGRPQPCLLPWAAIPCIA